MHMGSIGWNLWMLAAWLVPAVITLAALYFVIRLAVRHGIRDAWKDRDGKS